jgi:hypothetical protein
MVACVLVRGYERTFFIAQCTESQNEKYFGPKGVHIFFTQWNAGSRCNPEIPTTATVIVYSEGRKYSEFCYNSSFSLFNKQQHKLLTLSVSMDVSNFQILSYAIWSSSYQLM